MNASRSVTSHAVVCACRTPTAAERCGTEPDSARANVASAMPVIGTPEVETVLHGPAAGALLLRLVEHDVDERRPRPGVHVLQDVRGDLDEERLEVPGVPVGEDLPDLRRRGTQPLAQQVVRLRDELHVGVLDAVVHHLHEVPGTVGTDVGAARHAVDLGRDLLEDRAERLVRLLGAAGHDRRAEQRTLLTAGDARAHEVQALLAQRRLAPDRVREVRVARVHDDVALLQEGHQLVDDRVRGAAGLHHDDDLARPGQRRDEVLDRLGRDEHALVAVVRDQRLGLGVRAVVDRHREAVACKVPGEVAAHHRQPGDTDLRGSGGGS